MSLVYDKKRKNKDKKRKSTLRSFSGTCINSCTGISTRPTASVVVGGRGGARCTRRGGGGGRVVGGWLGTGGRGGAKEGESFFIKPGKPCSRFHSKRTSYMRANLNKNKKIIFKCDKLYRIL